MNPNMIDSRTGYHEDSSSDDGIEDLDARIAKYANLESRPIGRFTDSDSEQNKPEEFTDSDSKDSDEVEDEEEEEESESEEESEEEMEAQTESFNVSVRVRPLFPKEKMLNYKSVIRVSEDKFVVLKNPEVTNKNDYMS